MKEKFRKFIHDVSWSFFQIRHKIWNKRPWKGQYETVAEKTVMPYINDVNAWFWLGWFVFFVSLFGEVSYSALDTFFSRSGAVLVACGVIIELKVSQLRIAMNQISNGIISPRGMIHSAHLPGQFVQEWNNEQVNNAPVSMWLMARTNDAYKFEARAFWAVIVGTVVWAYGDKII